MKILNKPKTKIYRGTCQECKCRIEANEDEVSTLVDRDSPEGADYVKCPRCGNPYLWVS